MKKSIFAIALLGMCIGFTACEDPTKGQDPDNSQNPDTTIPDSSVTKQLSADETKDYLVEVGKQFINTFNPEDQRAATELATELYEKYETWDWEVIGSQMEDEFNKMDADGFFRLPRRIAAFANGEQALLTDKEILFSFATAGRKFVFNDQTKKMEVSKTNDNTAIAQFKDAKGTMCEVKVWGEGKTIKGSYTYEEYSYGSGYQDEYGNWIEGEKIYEGMRTIKVELPETIHMYFKQGNKSIMNLDFTFDTNIKDYVNHSMALKVVNITFEEDVKATTTNASAAFSMKYGDKQMLIGACSVPKYKIEGWTGGSDITDDEIESWIRLYEDKYETMLGTLKTGEGSVDIMGKVQAKMNVTDGAALYDGLKAWDKKEYGTELDSEKEFCNVINKYTKVGLYYGSATKQADVIMQPTYETVDETEYDYETDSYITVKRTYYYSVPNLYFPQDGTTYEVTTFFESSKFNILTDMAEELVNKYKELDTKHLVFGEGRIEF